jgi:hypothetical protein
MHPAWHIDLRLLDWLHDGHGVYDQIKTAFQDVIAPELHASG